MSGSGDKAGRFTTVERDLGLDVAITRRDFLGAALLGAGTMLLDAPAPLRSRPPTTNPDWEGYGGIGDYARSHGNMWATLDTAHALRDGKFGDRARSAAVDTGEHYDLIVVGGGISGLGAAAFFQKDKGGRCLVLDNQPMVGGEAKRNEFLVGGIRLIGPQGSNDFGVELPAGWVGDYWKDLNLPYGSDSFEYQSWAPGIEPLPMARDNYYFQIWGDEFASHGYFFKQPDGSFRLVRDPFGDGFEQTPWPESLRADFRKWRSNPKVYDGPDLARWLDGMTYEQLIVKQLGLDPAVARYVDPILAGAAGGLGSDVISAQCAGQIGLPGTGNGAGGRRNTHKLADSLKYGSSFPGGNDGIMRHIVKKLIPEAIAGQGFAGVLNAPVRFDALDRPGNPTRIRLSATAIRVANLPNGTVEVFYVTDGSRIHRTTASGVVMAGGAWVSQYVVADTPEPYREAFKDFVRAPMLVVNVAVRHWRFMYDLGITAASYRDQFGFSCNIRQSMVVGDYRPPLHPDKPTLITFYVPFERPGAALRDQAVAARTELLGTSYRDYERQIREQMSRLFAKGGFDPRADIAGIILNRWGHAYVCPAPGFYFGRNGRPAAPEVLRQPVGRIAFANSDLHGHQNWIDATAEGRRATGQLTRA